MNRTLRFLLPIALLMPGVAAASGSPPQTFQGLAAMIVNLLNSATGVLIVLGLVIYFWGAASGLLRGDTKDYTKLRNQLVWGVVVIFVMVSIWGIVQLLQNTLFGGDATNGTGGTQTSSCSAFGDC